MTCCRHICDSAIRGCHTSQRGHCNIAASVGGMGAARQHLQGTNLLGANSDAAAEVPTVPSFQMDHALLSRPRHGVVRC